MSSPALSGQPSGEMSEIIFIKNLFYHLIRSECTEDGTWEPYPTCDGDPRETQDGCNPCPGPNGGPRSRSGGNSTISAGARNTGGNRGGSGGARRGNNGGQRNNQGAKRVGGGAKRGGGQNRQSGGAAPRRNQVNNNSIKNTPQKAPARKEFQTPRALSGNNNSNNRVSSSNNSGQCPGLAD